MRLSAARTFTDIPRNATRQRAMKAVTGELFPSYNAVEARRESEMEMIREKLAKNEKVDTPVCKVERVSA